jgi:hypothetical protein
LDSLTGEKKKKVEEKMKGKQPRGILWGKKYFFAAQGTSVFNCVRK